MKKIVFLTLCLIVSMLSFVGCKKGGLQETKGLVTKVKIHDSTLVSARILVDGDTIVFDMKDVRIVGDMFVAGDSVKVHYIEGYEDTLRAMLVSLVPKTIHFVIPSESVSDTLVTNPVNAEEGQQKQQ